MRRLIVPLSLVLIAALAPPPHAAAQDSIRLIRQAEDYTFGEVLHFTAEAQGTTVFTEATVTVQIPNHPDIVIPATQLPRSSHLAVTQEVNPLAEGIPPFAKVNYYWELATFGGATLTTDVRTFRYEDDRVPWDWHTQRRENVVVHWDGQDTGVAQIALDVASDSLPRIANLLGTQTGEDIHVYVYPDLEPLVSGLRLHNRYIQDWVSALSLPDQSLILLTAASGPSLFVDLSRDLPHELTHILLYRAAGDNAANLPAWYNEGLAILSSAEPDAALRVTLESSAQNSSLLPLASLCAQDFAALQPADAALAYAQSESLMRYIRDHYGSVGVQALLAAYADGASCEVGVERALGVSLADLEDNWEADLRRNMTVGTSWRAALVPWLLLAGFGLLLALLFIAPPLRRNQPHNATGDQPQRPLSAPHPVSINRPPEDTP